MAIILLLGPDGQVGWELRRTLASLGQLKALGHAQLDLGKTDALRDSVQQLSPAVIVNAAAYTAVDKAESEPDVAMKVNCDAVRVLAEEARKSGALLIHYSTDYVFDGTKAGAYTEDDEPNPLSVYGRTKLCGERAIQASGCRHLIFRSSWIYGQHGGNFAKTIFRLAKEREELRIVADQVGAPTAAELLADVTASCLERVLQSTPDQPFTGYGVYHVSPSGYTSWHGYAAFLVETAAGLGVRLELSADKIHPISSREYAAPATRPANSRLATDKLTATFALDMPHWKKHLRPFIAQLAAADSR